MAVNLSHRPALTDKQNYSNCDEGGTDSEEGAALPGTSNCQKYDADTEKHGGRSSRSRRTGRLVAHAPNDSSSAARREDRSE
jgi:hypothetical protein